MLKLENVHTYYGTSHILQGVSFTVPEGKCYALLGRNGAGKTTTIHSIAGLTPPKEGKIYFKGKAIHNLSVWKVSRLGIGLVPQGRRIFPSLTVKENLIMSQRPPASSNGKIHYDLDTIYDMFPILKERENNWGNELSGGQQQMLAIGRALLTNPEFLLMDEPSEGLAPVIIDQIGDVVLKLKESGLSILMVEQNIELATRAADQVLIMNKGRIVWSGTPEELLQNEQIKQQYLGV